MDRVILSGDLNSLPCAELRAFWNNPEGAYPISGLLISFWVDWIPFGDLDPEMTFFSLVCSCFLELFIAVFNFLELYACIVF